jgi:hypothetical protein
MKKILIFTILIIGAISIKAQAQNFKTYKSDNQNITQTATLKSASRLFAIKDDLTSVILIIPIDSVVTVLDTDSIYFHVVFNENEGYIFKRTAVLNTTPVIISQASRSKQPEQAIQPVQEQQESRFSYLEKKYGSSMAARLNSGKIWKGMNSEMVRDSWGSPQKINREISGNLIKEEWIYKNSWLYLENNTLVEWGPVNK